MTELVEVICEDDRWAQLGLASLANVACGATLAHLGLARAEFEISLLGCDDARIGALNAEFRDQHAATNILSWPSRSRFPGGPGGGQARPDALGDEHPDEMPDELGDMAISFEKCAHEAQAAGKPMREHVTHLLVHGTLHLLGYDHIDDKDATKMERLEAQVLATLGLKDPYKDSQGILPD